ncbi:TetR/AcrR family transcriptional regulator [Chryseosolibacter indicus]|uniref:TetR/AcrR family transcriptional regulator n=1 Tax=Chryseosolibacter indicus TaxID=2782351 RepID=A0ABS5VST4_9BACT|nr:TetR/AcrR family transcriptional regulator [Chryseosolibacter indicus]MBT1704093.1 TetR/AcrR family transcriptional regulator [Chryseosolibacter indicus]
MPGRPSTFNDEEVVLKAQKVFWTKGYTATSMEDLLKAMGMGLGSFYNAFKGGKKELFQRALAERRLAFEAFKRKLEESNDPIQDIKDFFLSIADTDIQTHMQGCIVVNTAVEMTFVDKDLEKASITILNEVERLFIDTIKQAQKQGKLKTKTKATLLGRYLITLWNGINITRRMHPDRSVLREQIKMQLSLIE